MGTSIKITYPRTATSGPFGTITIENRAQDRVYEVFDLLFSREQSKAPDKLSKEYILDFLQTTLSWRYYIHRRVVHCCRLNRAIYEFLADRDILCNKQDEAQSRHFAALITCEIWQGEQFEVDKRNALAHFRRLIEAPTPISTDSEDSMPALRDVPPPIPSVGPLNAQRDPSTRSDDEEIKDLIEKLILKRLTQKEKPSQDRAPSIPLRIPNPNYNGTADQPLTSHRETSQPLQSNSIAHLVDPPPRRQVQHVEPADRNPAQSRSDPKTVISTLTSFYKGDGRCFSGSDKDDWTMFKRRFADLANVLCLTPEERIIYLRYGLTGQAEHFFYEHIDGKVTNWGTCIEFFESKFNSSIRQDQMLQKLRRLRIQDFQRSGISDANALRNLTTEIEKLSTMIPPPSRTDEALRLTLKDAVLGMPWARHVATNVDPKGLTYKQYADLLEASVAEHELHSNAGQPGSSLSGSFRQSRYQNNTRDIAFAGQRRYAVDPRQLRRRMATSLGTQEGDGCYNCGGSHQWLDCQKELDYKRIVEKQVKRYEKRKNRRTGGKLRRTLFGMAETLQDILDSSQQPPSDTDDDNHPSCSSSSSSDDDMDGPAEIKYSHLLSIADQHAEAIAAGNAVQEEDF